MNKCSARLPALPGLASVLLALAGMAAARAAEIVAAGPAIEEIIVTARKREETLLRVPVSVTAFSADRIEQLGFTDITDLARFTPGFALNSALGRQPASFRPVFRGVTTVRNGVGNANAGTIFIDGVYVGGALLSTEIQNLERVEIMRGPQSAQYGRNTYIGAVNYITRRPSAKLEAGLSGSVAQHDSFDATGWVSGPLGSERLKFALGGSHREYGGEWTNTRDGSDIGGEESDEVTTKLLIEPLEELDLTVKLGWQSTDDQHFPMYLQPSTFNNCCFRTAEAPRAREYYVGKAVLREEVNLYTDLLEANGGAGVALERFLGSLAVNWRAGAFTFSALTGLVSDDLDLGFDASYAGYDPSVVPVQPPGSFLIFENKEYDDLSQELRVTSAADRPLRFTAGLYYYDGEADTAVRNRIDPNTGVASPEPRSRDEIENRAVFGSVDWDFRDRWTAGVELRWAEDDVTVTSLGVPGPSGSGTITAFEADFDSLTPRFTIAWHPQDDVTYYLNVSKGTKPGDFNSQVPSLPNGAPDESYRFVDEETAWNYELGVKALFWEERLSLSLAGYYLEVQDQQLTQLIELAGGGTASLLTNAQRTDVRGIELEVGAMLAEGLVLDVTYAYTDSEFDEWISQEEADLRGSDGSLADNQRLGDVSGHNSPRVPKHMASLIARYQRQLTDRIDWYGSADYSYESSKYAAEHNLIETGDRNLVGLRTGIRAGRWDLSIWARNLFDDDTPVDVIRYFDRRYTTLPSFPQQGGRVSSTPRGFAVPLPPGRQTGLTVRYRF